MKHVTGCRACIEAHWCKMQPAGFRKLLAEPDMAVIWWHVQMAPLVRLVQATGLK